MKKFLVIAFLFLFLIGLASIPLLLPLAKQVRAEQHLQAAYAFKEEGDMRAAYFKVLSAHNLVDDDPEINKLLGIYGSAIFHYQALDQWLDAAEDGLLNFEETVEMVRYGLRINEAEKVKPWLYALAREDPDNKNVQVLQVSFLQRDRRDGRSRALAKKLVEEGNLELGVYAAYVQGTLGQGTVEAEEREEAFARLRETANLEGETGMYSIRILMRLWDNLSEPDKEALADALEQNTLATLGDYLRLLTLRKQDGADADVILEEAQRRYRTFAAKAETEETDPNQISPKNLFVDWLNAEGHHRVTLSMLPVAEEITDPNLFLARQMALLAMDDPASVRDASLADNPMSPARNFVCRAIAQARLGEEDKVLPNLELAVESARYYEVEWLERILASGGAFDLILDMYEGLAKRMNRPIPVQIRLLNYYYALGEELEVRRIAQAVQIDQLKGILTEEVQIFYYLCLYAEDQDAVRRHLEWIITKYPNIIELRLFLAFQYARSGMAEASLELIEGWDRFAFNRNRQASIMLAFIHAAAGEIPAARELAATLATFELLDQERVLVHSLI